MWNQTKPGTMSPELLTHRIISQHGCWLWTGERSKDGYGLVMVDGLWRFVHRESFKQAKGKIPVGMEVMHVCPFGAIRRCFNPGHLKPGTHQQNCEAREYGA